MRNRTLLWFVVALVPMVVAQIVRLYQHAAWAWLAADYAGRLGALAILFAIPAARVVAFTSGKRRVGWIELAAWIVGIVLFSLESDRFFVNWVYHVFPRTAVGTYPTPTGALRLFDMTAGLALVAFYEEIVFRRYARALLVGWLGDGWTMVLASAILFGAYHWWTGIGNIVATFLIGICMMLSLRRTGILWPIVVAHYLIDALIFYG